MSRGRVVVGMSGGVDSSVTAAILKEKGYDVTGVFIEAYNEPGCRTDEDKKDALQAALRIGIPFQVLDVKKEYKEKVVKYFFEEYKAGRTPNPDIVCNSEVKFGLFFDWAKKEGFEKVATGHYARVARITNKQIPITKQLLVQRAKDLGKDQSYFLWKVDPDKLEDIIWPLGTWEKGKVRGKARELGLKNAEKPDSMGVCMMGELNVREFLKEKLGEKEGEIILDGKKVGKHKGMWFFTIGQRSGYELDKKSMKKLGYETDKMEPLYVVAKDAVSNRVILGSKEEASRDEFGVENLKLFVGEQEMKRTIDEEQMYVRIRNLGELVKVKNIDFPKGLVRTVKPIFAPAEGQAAVLYQAIGEDGDEIVVGGGTISVSPIDRDDTLKKRLY